MLISWHRLRPGQRRFLKYIIAILLVEVFLEGIVSCGQGLQQIFWLRWRHLLNTAQPVRQVPYASVINQCGEMYGVDPALIAAVIRCESDFNPRAVSRAGAVGLMQLCIPTWQQIKQGQKQWRSIADGENDLQALYQPEINIAAGTLYLQAMLRRYRGDPVKALAAYNAGPGSVDRSRGMPPLQETIRYVHHVAAVWREYRGVADATITFYHWGRVLEHTGNKLCIYFHWGVGGVCGFVCLQWWRSRPGRRW